jgi:hypothetical protein
MSSDTFTLEKSYKAPWTSSAFNALPGNPVSIGFLFTVALLIVFFAGRVLAFGGSDSAPNDLRVAVTQILITSYSATAYAYLLISIEKTTRDLSAVARKIPNYEFFVDQAGKHPWWLLPLLGASAYLLIGIPVTHATTPHPIDPWAWQTWSYDVFWHRLTTVFFVWWMSCFAYVIIVESARLSRMSNKFPSPDLLNLDPYRPLVRQGLINALLVIGMASVLSLLGVESRYFAVLVGFWIMSVLLAWIGMMLPLRGIRGLINKTKRRELQWCKESLIRSRDSMKSGADQKPTIAEITAYQNVIENIRNWPFDSPTLIRFTLYLLIPLGSWLGGALVERGLDLILS